MQEEKEYIVTWEINIWATSPEKAAIKAQKIQRNKHSMATIYDIQDRDTGIITEHDLFGE